MLPYCLSNIFSQAVALQCIVKVIFFGDPARFERTTYRLGICCSILLSYGAIGLGIVDLEALMKLYVGLGRCGGGECRRDPVCSRVFGGTVADGLR